VLVPVPVGVALRVMVLVVRLMAVMVVPPGMLAPLTFMPTARSSTPGSVTRAVVVLVVVV
jgi:hypothetical protein